MVEDKDRVVHDLLSKIVTSGLRASEDEINSFTLSVLEEGFKGSVRHVLHEILQLVPFNVGNFFLAMGDLFLHSLREDKINGNAKTGFSHHLKTIHEILQKNDNYLQDVSQFFYINNLGNPEIRHRLEALFHR